MVLDNSNLNGNSDARPPIDRAVEIERLAALEAIDYEVARKDAADRIGIRASTLDREVAKKRRALGLDKSDDDAGQGRAVTIQDVLPWAEAIEGDRVATGLAAALKRYVVLSDTAADAVALWVLHTWLFDKFTIAPRLAITSPTKGCGKTTVLRFINQVVRRRNALAVFHHRHCSAPLSNSAPPSFLMKPKNILNTAATFMRC